MRRLIKFWFLPRREKQLFCEAGILLLLCSLCVKTIPFRHIDSFLRAYWNNTTGNLDHGKDIELAMLSLARAATLLPGRRLCLSRSIAAFIMLHRRGIPAMIVAGVRFSEDSSLVAHAWVHTGHEVTDATYKNSAFAALVRIGQGPVTEGATPSHIG
jgi:hypothetical protein